MAHILVVVDAGGYAGVVYETLNRAGHATAQVEHPARAWEILAHEPVHFGLVVMCDLAIRRTKNGAWLADALSRKYPDLPVVIITDESPTASLYREAELTGAIMIDKKTLDAERFLGVVNELVRIEE